MYPYMHNTNYNFNSVLLSSKLFPAGVEVPVSPTLARSCELRKGRGHKLVGAGDIPPEGFVQLPEWIHWDNPRRGQPQTTNVFKDLSQTKVFKDWPILCPNVQHLNLLLASKATGDACLGLHLSCQTSEVRTPTGSVRGVRISEFMPLGLAPAGSGSRGK